MHQDREGSVRLARREFIGTVNIADVYELVIFKMNPGLASQFPWLHGIATSFQKYAFLGLAIEYVPTSGIAVGGTNSALGQIAMAFNYDVSNPASVWPATSLTGVLNLNGSTSCSPAAPGVCYMECDPSRDLRPMRLVQTDSSTFTGMSTADFVVADFIIATSGARNTTPFQAGQLWVTYEILLTDPRPVNPTPSIGDRFGSDLEELIKDYVLLNRCIGPFTPVQAVNRAFELERIQQCFQDPSLLKVLQRWQVQQIEADHPSPLAIGKLEERVEDLLDILEARVLHNAELTKPALPTRVR
jgi:hypothetical protein